MAGHDGERALVRGDGLGHGAHLVHDPAGLRRCEHPTASSVGFVFEIGFNLNGAAVRLERGAVFAEGVVGGAQRLPRGARVGYRA